jgi:hypothetical protein
MSWWDDRIEAGRRLARELSFGRAWSTCSVASAFLHLQDASTLAFVFVARYTTMLGLSFSTLGILAPILLVVQVLVGYLRNPLRKVPAAHPLAHFTSLWIHSVRWRGIENATLKAAHDRLGPIVCLGPEEISVNCVKGGIRDVYAGGFEKSNPKDGYNWYGFFSNYEG